MSAFIKKNSGKCYLTQNDYLKNRFGQKVVKLSVNAGLSCPNRDGKKSTGGCTYCSASLSGDFSQSADISITNQLYMQKEILKKKWGECLYIPYFQAGSNTYAPLETLKKMYSEALSFENTVGISIATRADCVDTEIADYLKKLSESTYLTVELGLQSIHDKTACSINRCHTYQDFLDTYRLLKERNINICVHIINGLPGESTEMMMQTAREVSKLKPHSVKIHMLHIIKNTTLAKEYEALPFNLLTLEEYINLICDQIEIMDENIIIERVTGDGDKRTLIAPLWTANKKAVLNGIDKELRRRRTYQGIKKDL